MPFRPERGGGGGIDIGHREEDQEHDPHLAHLAAARAGEVAVGQFVERLEQRIGDEMVAAER